MGFLPHQCRTFRSRLRPKFPGQVYWTERTNDKNSQSVQNSQSVYVPHCSRGGCLTDIVRWARSGRCGRRAHGGANHQRPDAGEREQIAAAAAAKPSIDIEINFDFRSAKISRSAASAVDTLGKALSNPDLKGSTFVLAGHTDGKGSLSYNQELSEKRVDTVKRYLVTHFKLSPANLVAVGYGKTKLKNANDPFGPENRRVQVVNMSESD